MLLREIFFQAIKNLQSNKFRSFLTLFGISWGVIAIMILIGFGLGFRTFFYEGMTKVGRDLIVFFPRTTSIRVPGTQTGRPVLFRISDIPFVKAKCPLVKEFLPVCRRYLEIKVGNASRSYDTRGVLPQTKRINNWFVAEGRFLIENDLKERRRFAFLGAHVKETLFGDKPATGETVRINNILFTVIGVGKKKEPQLSSYGSQDDYQVLIPFTTAEVLFRDNRTFNMAFIEPVDRNRTEETIQQFRTVLAERQNFDPDDEEALMVFDMTYFMDMIGLLVAGLNVLLTIIGFTTLGIGGIGVMNIMLLSAQERTREIGIRKAVGAKKRDIRFQFLSEAVVITFIGGMFGYILGGGIMLVLSRMNLPPTVPLPQNSPILTVIAIACIMLVGILSGYLPAKRAAELAPITALHYERGELSTGQKIPKSLWVSKSSIGELIGEAITEIRMGKLRTLLTTFGIFWGIASVIILMGFGIGFKQYFNFELKKMGDKLIQVYGGRAQKGIGGYREGKDIRLTEKDVQALKTFPFEIEDAVPEINCGFPIVKYGKENRAVHTLGGMKETAKLRNFKVAEGRFIDNQDVRQRSRVCFIGANVKERLFDDSKRSVIGENIRIAGLPFLVVGVAVKKGRQLSINNSLDDDKIIIPITTAGKIFRSDKYITRMLISPVDRNHFKQCVREINRVLGRLHGFDPDDEEALKEYSQLEGMDMLNYIYIALEFFLGGVGLITLIIGGVGVLNIMLFTVSQRVHEIGIRRAIGAHQKHIFFQFLLEALIITFIGGIIGYGVGAGFNWIMNALPLPDMVPAPQNTVGLSISATFFLVSVGILAGTLPALRAMKLNIVESLRYE